MTIVFTKIHDKYKDMQSRTLVNTLDIGTVLVFMNIRDFILSINNATKTIMKTNSRSKLYGQYALSIDKQFTKLMFMHFTV